MRSRILAIALATVAATGAADAAFARDAGGVSDSGQVSIQRHRKAHRAQLPNVVAVDSAAVAIASTYGWSVPYVGSLGGYGYSTDW